MEVNFKIPDTVRNLHGTKEQDEREYDFKKTIHKFSLISVRMEEVKTYN